MRIFAAIIWLAALVAFADPCRVVWVDPNVKAIAVTCSNWGFGGITKTFTEISVNDWAKANGLDTVKSDTSKNEKSKGPISKE